MMILGLDPGKVNCAYAIVEMSKSGKCTVIKTGMIEKTIPVLTGNVRQLSKPFKKEIRIILKKFNVEAIFAERFMSRGRFNGASSEVINIMLGCLLSMKIEHVQLVTPAQWKNAFNKVDDLKGLYKQSKLVAHRIDAALIAVYGSHYLLPKVKPFNNVDINKCKNKLLQPA